MTKIKAEKFYNDLNVKLIAATNTLEDFAQEVNLNKN